MLVKATGVLAGLVLAANALAGSSTAEDQPAQATPPQAEKATVTKIVVKRPHKVVHQRRRFTPSAHPTPGYVNSVVLPYEAARAGASLAHLRNRSFCESHWQWWANNGQYNGIGQFAYSTYARGMSTIGSRTVELTVIKYRRMHSKVIRFWSDGKVTWHKGRVRRQTIIQRLHGTMQGGYTDVWAQARIMAQAMVGRSAVHDSEWSCR